MWTLGDQVFKSRILLGTSRYPSPQTMADAIRAAGTQIVTVSLRRQRAGDGQHFWNLIQALNVAVLPNTAGCRSVNEVVTTARLAREVFQTNWIKLETVGDDLTLQPEPFMLVEAAQILCAEGFEVFPYMTEDLAVAERLVAAGCRILMPWASPIGSGLGLANVMALKTLRARFPKVTMLVDAGLGTPSQAAHAMELGMDGVLLNTAVAQAVDPVQMAKGFALAVEAGRLGFEAGLMPTRNFATASTPQIGTPFWHEATPS